MSALMAAAMNRTKDIVELLLYNGAIKYAKNGDGFTAYDYVPKTGQMDDALALR